MASTSPSLLDVIDAAWAWIGLCVGEVIDVNAFGNVLVRAVDGAYWRICPEELFCKPIAKTTAEFDQLRATAEFKLDWDMQRPVDVAKETLGPLPKGHCYCLKVPAVLGGEYALDNYDTISLRELIAFAGDVAQQIKDLPDETSVSFKSVLILAHFTRA